MLHKEKYFWTLMTIFFIAIIGNQWYYHSKTLDQPIVFDHDIYMEASPEGSFQLFYLVNRHDSTHIRKVFLTEGDKSVPLQPQAPFQPFSSHQGHHDTFGEFNHYAINTANLHLNDHILIQLLAESDHFVTDKMTVEFSDGTSQDIDINLSITEPKPRPKQGLSHHASVSSSPKSSDSYRAQENISIDQITYPLRDQFPSGLQVKVQAPAQPGVVNDIEQLAWNEVPGDELENISYPLTLEENESILVTHQATNDLTIMIAAPLILHGETETGESFQQKIHLSNLPYHLDQEALIEFIETKGR
ncbi:hypothetical protein [Alkalibacillus aidingensis]|uniref:hypothetical protein n=1 Tax=Alkalibacillus aidingensis TaxID=2747607 RepID=UPI0016607C08|nr:hypothetical protein [Alkalibacillus aidingensis]